ncbi:hypothetical protein UY3_05599 [Chelonia mydas]|uniref:Uncharacterized protein n=1 Tax=Chelonia mydas TaxID=8469 RepID=M7BYP7_CHEMY|nr:hypothetical protein UY3_05599 [Chelonia mydas]
MVSESLASIGLERRTVASGTCDRPNLQKLQIQTNTAATLKLESNSVLQNSQ